MAAKDWDAAAYRERALMAQKKAAEAPTAGLKTLWLELAERYFELADQVGPDAELRFPHKLHAPQRGGRIFIEPDPVIAPSPLCTGMDTIGC